MAEGPGVDMSEVGARGSSRPAERTSPEQGPSSLHLVWGVQQQETVSETREGRGGSTQFGEATALPS